MNQEEYLHYLTEQATAAVAAGADQGAVEAQIAALMQKAGFQIESGTGAKVSKATKAAYKDVVIPQVVQDISTRKNSPSIFGDVEAGSDSTARNRIPEFASSIIGHDAAYQKDLEETQSSTSAPDINGRYPWDEGYDRISGEYFARQADRAGLDPAVIRERELERIRAQQSPVGAFKQGAGSGVLRSASGLVNLYPTENAQNLAKELRHTAAEKSTLAEGLAGQAGLLAGILAPIIANPTVGTAAVGTGQGNAAFEDAKEAGASDSSALAYGLTQGASFPILGAVAPSMGTGLVSKLLSGGAIGAGTGIAQRAISNLSAPESLQADVFDTKALLFDTALGSAFGALHKPPLKQPKPSPKQLEIPKIRDEAFDAGIAAIDSIDHGNIDISKPFTQDFPANWSFKNLEVPESKVNVETSPLDSVRKLDETIAAYAQRARQRTDENFLQSDRQQNAQEISRAAIEDGEPAPVEQPPVAPNEALRTPEMEQLRSKLQVEDATQNAGMPQQPVDVTFNPEKPTYPAPATTKLGKQRIAVDETGASIDRTGAGNVTKAAPKARTLEESIAAATARRNIFNEPTKPVADIPADYRTSSENAPLLRPDHSIAPDVLSRLQKGILTAKEFLSSVVNGEHESYAKTPDMIQFAQAHLDRAKKFGGEHVGIGVFNPNDPVHEAILNKAKEDHPNVRANALYDPQHHKILLMQNTTANTLLHEIDHAVKLQAISLGERGLLNGRARQAFTNLNDSFNLMKSHLIDYATHNLLIRRARLSKEEQAALWKNMTYGLKNLHELNAEISGNPVFRNFLRSIKLDSLPLEPAQKDKLSGIRNVLDLFIKKFNKLIGIGEKSQTAYDALYGGSEKFFESIDADEAHVMKSRKVQKELNAPEPDYSFLGDRAEARMDATGEAPVERQKPRSEPVQIVKQLFAAKGIEPKVFDAKRTKQNLASEGELEAVQSANRLAAVRTKQNTELLDKAMSGDVQAYGKLSPAAKKVVQAEYTNNFDRSMEIAKLIAADPNRTAEHEAIAHKIIQNAGTYQATAYAATQIKGFMKDKLGLYEKAKTKIAAGQDLSPEELEAHKSVDIAKKYLEQTWLPELDKLKGMRTDKLEELYKYHTQLNPDEQFKGFEPEDRRAAMRGAIAKQLRALTDDNKNSALEELVKNVAGFGSKKNNTRLYYQGLRRSADVYSALKEVPDELRQFWGVIADPVARNIATVRKQYSYLSNLKAQQQLLQEGGGALFSDVRNNEHSQGLSGSKLGPLQGKFTSPDVARALDSVFQMDASIGDMLDASLTDNSGMGIGLFALRKLGGGVRTVAGKTKLLKVLGNPGNFILNAEGSILQLAANGNINPVTYAKGIKMIADTLLADRRSGMSVDARDAFRYGLVEYSHIEELRGNKAAKRILSIIKDIENEPNAATALVKKLYNYGKAVPEAYKEIYAAMDLYTKFANWHHELDFWRDFNERHGTSMTDDQLKTMVARRINDTNITPSMAPQILKLTESAGVTQFATYYSEVMRTSKNNLLTAGQDMARGVQEGDGHLFLHGFKRLLGTGSAIVAHNKQFAAIAKLTAGAMGLAATQLEDDDPRKKYMDGDKFWNSMQPMILSDPNSPSSKEYVYDVSRPDPFAPLWNPTRAGVEAVAALANGDKATAATKAKIALDNMRSLVDQRNSMWTAAYKAITGTAPAIARTAPSTYNDIKKQLTESGLSSENANRIMAVGEVGLPKAVVNYAASKEEPSKPLSKLQAAGVGVMPLDIKKDVGNFLGFKAKKGIQEAKASYMDLMKQNYTSSPERLEKGFISAIKKAEDSYSSLQSAVQAAKAQGADRRQIVEELKNAGVGKEMMGALLHDGPMSIGVMVGDLKQDLKDDLVGATAEEKSQARERYRYNANQLRALIRKYRSVNLEEL